mmetsp:Transcript_42019/g.105640  ORF Transcript_42019/g.105640 Transcript_42019/m.105640 type:complete len:788 (+) Transcript_42019:120-2483(+)
MWKSAPLTQQGGTSLASRMANAVKGAASRVRSYSPAGMRRRRSPRRWPSIRLDKDVHAKEKTLEEAVAELIKGEVESREKQAQDIARREQEAKRLLDLVSEKERRIDEHNAAMAKERQAYEDVQAKMQRMMEEIDKRNESHKANKDSGCKTKKKTKKPQEEFEHEDGLVNCKGAGCSSRGNYKSGLCAKCVKNSGGKRADSAKADVTPSMVGVTVEIGELPKVKGCSVSNCLGAIKQDGLCATHLREHLKKNGVAGKQVKRAKCKVVGCDATRAQDDSGYCKEHLDAYLKETKNTVPLCEKEGCPAESFQDGLCSKHWRLWASKNEDEEVFEKMTKCCESGCGQDCFQDGLCSYHWKEKSDRNEFIKMTKCNRDGCSEDCFEDGLCERHYKAVKKPEAPRPARPRLCPTSGCQQTGLIQCGGYCFRCSSERKMQADRGLWCQACLESEGMLQQQGEVFEGARGYSCVQCNTQAAVLFGLKERKQKPKSVHYDDTVEDNVKTPKANDRKASFASGHSFHHALFDKAENTGWLSTMVQALWHSSVFHKIFDYVHTSHEACFAKGCSGTVRFLRGFVNAWEEYTGLADRAANSVARIRISALKSKVQRKPGEQPGVLARLATSGNDVLGDPAEAIGAVYDALKEVSLYQEGLEHEHLQDLLTETSLDSPQDLNQCNSRLVLVPLSERVLNSRDDIMQWLPTNRLQVPRLKYRLAALGCASREGNHHVVFCRQRQQPLHCWFFDDKATEKKDLPWSAVSKACRDGGYVPHFALYEETDFRRWWSSGSQSKN